jgi:hypothetical protein
VHRQEIDVDAEQTREFARSPAVPASLRKKKPSGTTLSSAGSEPVLRRRAAPEKLKTLLRQPVEKA